MIKALHSTSLQAPHRQFYVHNTLHHQLVQDTGNRLFVFRSNQPADRNKSSLARTKSGQCPCRAGDTVASPECAHLGQLGDLGARPWLVPWPSLRDKKGCQAPYMLVPFWWNKGSNVYVLRGEIGCPYNPKLATFIKMKDPIIYLNSKHPQQYVKLGNRLCRWATDLRNSWAVWSSFVG